EKTPVIGIDLERLDSYTVNEVSRVQLGNNFAHGFLGSFENCQLNSVPCTEGDNFFIASLRCGHFGHHFHASPRLNQRFSSHALRNAPTSPRFGSVPGAPRWQVAISARGYSFSRTLCELCPHCRRS